MRRPNSSREAHSERSTTAAADAGPVGAFEAEGVVAVADDEDDLGPQPAVGDAVEEVLQRRAAAAEQHRETNRGHRHSISEMMVFGSRGISRCFVAVEHGNPVLPAPMRR